MAEQATPSSVDDNDPNTSSDQPENNSQLVALPAENTQSAGIYVVQVPKDQIYRVPPPENAILAEHHGKPFRSNKKKPHRSCCLCCISM